MNLVPMLGRLATRPDVTRFPDSLDDKEQPPGAHDRPLRK
jgi:hypothetical protein